MELDTIPTKITPMIFDLTSPVTSYNIIGKDSDLEPHKQSTIDSN